MTDLLRAFVDAPGAVFLRTDTQVLTYAQVAARASALARRLHTLSDPGDRLALFAPPCPEHVVTLLAAYLAGLVVVPINTRYRGQEIGHILTDSGARILAHAGPLDALEGPPPATVETLLDISGADAPVTEDREPALEALDPAAGALIIYTSGTTGRSKGVWLAHRAVAANMGALTRQWRFAPDDRLSLMLPLFHVHGLCIGIHGAALHGMEVLLHERFDPGRVVADFAERGATVFMGVPTMYHRLLERLDTGASGGAALARGRLFTAGSAALPAADLARFHHHTGHTILERYGMSETLITLTNPYAGERRPGSVGRPVEGCAVKVVDEGGTEVAAGEPGEIYVRSNGIMDGYHGLPEATSRAFAGEYFKTGDVAVRDPDGYVKIVGRKSVDIIKSGGFKISAREIEEAILDEPGVREVAVLGMPDPTWGESIVAAVVPEATTDPRDLPERVVARVRQELADYKTPRKVVVMDELPRNALGKLQKHRLRDRF